MTLQLKLIVLAVVIAAFGSLAGYAYIKTKQAEILEREVKTLTASLIKCKDTLNIHEKAVIEGQKKLADAEAERQRRIAALNAQIAALRKKRPPEPKNCEAVIDWAKKNKDDLQWK